MYQFINVMTTLPHFARIPETGTNLIKSFGIYLHTSENKFMNLFQKSGEMCENTNGKKQFNDAFKTCL